jgi:hypothetical protein
MAEKEFKAMKSLRLNENIRILQAHESNCKIVLDESKYKGRLNTSLQSGVYKISLKNPAAEFEKSKHHLNTELVFLPS